MSIIIATPPEQGQLVHVRQRQWIVAEFDRSQLPDGPLHAGNGDPPGRRCR